VKYKYRAPVVVNGEATWTVQSIVAEDRDDEGQPAYLVKWLGCQSKRRSAIRGECGRRSSGAGVHLSCVCACAFACYSVSHNENTW
jgi:hypothetical protein